MSGVSTAVREPPVLSDPEAIIREARRRQHRRWTAIAAVLVVVSVIAISTSTLDDRHAASTHGAVRPARSHPTASAGSGPPAVGFLSTAYGSDVHSLSVWSWNGKRIRTLHTRRNAECCDVGYLSPDGTRLLIFDNTDKPQTGNAQELDLDGRVVAEGFRVGGMFMSADDSRHVCQLTSASLVLIDPGHGQRLVARLPLTYGPQGTPEVLRCSVVDDQAIVAEYGNSGAITVTAVNLSTGRATKPHWAPVAAATVIAISGNGRYLLEHARLGSEIVDTATGAVVAHLDSQPDAISWNGHLVVQSTTQTHLEIVDWRTGVVRWPPTKSLDIRSTFQVTARSRSDDLALTVATPDGHGHAALWLITPSTPSTLLDNAVAARFDR
jgi:hypothetical protein